MQGTKPATSVYLQAQAHYVISDLIVCFQYWFSFVLLYINSAIEFLLHNTWQNPQQYFMEGKLPAEMSGETAIPVVVLFPCLLEIGVDGEGD